MTIKKLLKEYFSIVLPTILIAFVYLKTFIYYQTSVINEFNIPSYLVEISLSNCLFVFGKSFLLLFKAFVLFSIIFLITNRLKEVVQAFIHVLFGITIYLLVANSDFLQRYILEEASGFLIAYFSITMLFASIKDYQKGHKFGVLLYAAIYFLLYPFQLEVKYSVINQTIKEKEFIVYSTESYIITKKQDVKTKKLLNGFSVKYLKDIKELNVIEHQKIIIKNSELFDEIVVKTRNLLGIKEKIMTN